MRYVATDGGLLLGPQRHFSHMELLLLSGQPLSAVRSAGFLAARYAASEPWRAYGKSVGLGVSAALALQVPDELWVACIPGPAPKLVFSDTPALLQRFEYLQAHWGMSGEGCEGSLPVFSPLHPEVALTADEILRG